MDENARKRKREEDGVSDTEHVDKEQSLEGLKRVSKKAKKQKVGVKSAKEAAASGESKDKVEAAKQMGTSAQKNKADKRRERRERRKQKKATDTAKKAAEKLRKKEQQVQTKPADQESSSDEEEITFPQTDEIGSIDMEDIGKELQDKAASTVSPSPFPDSPAFDAPTTQSGSSSISSLAPPAVSDEADPKDSTAASTSAKPATEPQTPKETPEELKLRLQARIEELRAGRKADGLNGKPARNRQELLEARRQKEEQRKAHKKDLRKQAKEEEERLKASKLARGSPLLSPGTFGRGSPLLSPATGSNTASTADGANNNNFSFGRVSFGNGQLASAQLNEIINVKPAKGPSDALTALQAAEKKQSHLASLDPATRAAKEEKDAWLNARKHAHGERVRDDTSLLKKTLKRKEKAKAKSKSEWTERIEGIKKAQALKQKRREDNLAKRREEKGKKGGGKKKKARPGFEGTFRARTTSHSGGGSKKN